MKNLWYLVAAYSVVWVVIASYLFVLVKRNKTLMGHVHRLEQRLRQLETKSRD